MVSRSDRRGPSLAPSAAPLTHSHLPPDGPSTLAGKLGLDDLQAYVTYSETRLPGLPGMQQHYEALAATVRARPAGAQAAGFEEFVDLFRAQVATVASNRTWAQTQVSMPSSQQLRSPAALAPHMPQPPLLRLPLPHPRPLPRSASRRHPFPPAQTPSSPPACASPQLSPKEISLLLQKSALTIPELGTVLATFRLLDYEGRGRSSWTT